VKLRGRESCSRRVLDFFRELSLSPSVAIHPYGGNKAPNKRFPSRWTERTNGKSDISMPRHPPSSCFFPSPHRVLSTVPRAPFDPSTSRLTLSPLYLTFLLFSHFTPPLPLHPPSTHSHIHRNWSLTTAKHYHIPIKITSSLLQILFLSPFFSTIFPFPLLGDTTKFSSRK